MRAVQLLILGIALVTFGLVIVASLFEWPPDA
jgi:hypothetical protein